MSQYTAVSSWISLFINLKIEYILTPWRITVDFQEETVTVSQRNWYLIGKKSDTIAFRFIREMNIKEHIWGADIMIKVAWHSVFARYIPKRKAKTIRRALIDYNQNKNSRIKFT